jgi:trk system potassium uptake protein TrkH
LGALAVIALIGRMVVMFALLYLVPIAFAVFEHDAAEKPFLLSGAATLTVGLAMSLATRRFRRELQPRDGFLLVGLTWAVLPVFGALPLWLAVPGLSLTDAYFEATSAFTATGATAITGLDRLPLSVNVWRCFMMFVGGLGIIALAVAILPVLGVGGSQLFKAETAGPMKDQKFAPRIADTARAIWVTYGTLAMACMLAYRAAGMSWVDAFMHACSTMGLGGFAAYDASFGAFQSPLIEAVATAFMLLAGVNFALYFLVWKRRSHPGVLLHDLEARGYALLMCAGSGGPGRGRVPAACMGVYPTFLDVSLRHASVQCDLRWPRPPAMPVSTTRCGRHHSFPSSCCSCAALPPAPAAPAAASS